MNRHGLPIIDADSHVGEPPDLWEGDYMDPNFRGASPFRWVDWTDPLGRNVTALWEGGWTLFDNVAYITSAGIPPEQLAAGVRYSEANPGGWDPVRRVADMDLEGIDHQIVNPSIAARVGYVENPLLADAMCRAYNDWVTDHCEATNGRVSANAVVPWQDPDLAYKELQRIADRECLRGLVIQPAPPYSSGFVGDGTFDHIYSLLEEAGMALVFHTNGGARGRVHDAQGPVNNLVEHYEPFWRSRICYYLTLGFPIESMIGYTQLIFEGVLDRHPRLNTLITESHGGWAVTWLERLDEYARGIGQIAAVHDVQLGLLPTEYFERQGFIVFESDEIAMGFAAEHIGSSMVWALDYPHMDCTFPGGTDELVQRLAKVPEPTRQGIAFENAARLFGLTGSFATESAAER